MLLCAAFLFNLASCNSGNESYIFKTSIYGNPKTLDPQTARYDSSASVIYNVFQGLFKYDNDGNITNGMIDSFSVSDDGLVWTFELKNDVRWSDGNNFTANCTADDYVFAFERLFRPSTKSSRAGEYFIIKNAEAISEGKIADLSQLGVKAIDTYSLEITLEEPCAEFSALLTLPPAMPCNREFFESTEGRYGLAPECIASNGNYYVHTWSYDEWSDENNYFILRRNSENQSSVNIPTGINLFIDPVDELKEFEDGTFQAYKGKSADEISDLNKKYTSTAYETEVWGIIFNHNGNLSNLNYRLELAQCIDYSGESEIYTDFNAIIPDCVSLSGDKYRELGGAAENKSAVLPESGVGTLASMKMIMPEGTSLRDCIGDILQNWQSECGFYCSISELNDSVYTQALSSGDFDIALVKLSGEYNSPYAYLNDFMGDNARNYSGYSSPKFSHIMNSAVTAADAKTAAAYYTEAEQLLLDNAIFVPLCTEKGYVFYSEKMQGLSYNAFMDFYSYSMTQ